MIMTIINENPIKADITMGNNPKMILRTTVITSVV